MRRSWGGVRGGEDVTWVGPLKLSKASKLNEPAEGRSWKLVRGRSVSSSSLSSGDGVSSMWVDAVDMKENWEMLADETIRECC